MGSILPWIVLALAAWGLVGLLDLLVAWVWGHQTPNYPAPAVLVLTQNQEEQVEGLVRGLLRLMGNSRRPRPRVVVVDLASKDDTAVVLERLARETNQIHLVRLTAEQVDRACETAMFLSEAPVKVMIDLRGRINQDAILHHIATLCG